MTARVVGTPGIAVLRGTAPPAVAQFRPNQGFPSGSRHTRVSTTGAQPPHFALLNVDGPYLTYNLEHSIEFSYVSQVSRSTSTARIQTSKDANGTASDIELAVTLQVPPWENGMVVELVGSLQGSANAKGWARLDGNVVNTTRFEFTKPGTHTFHLGFREGLPVGTGSGVVRSVGVWRLKAYRPGIATHFGQSCGASPLRGEGIVRQGNQYTLNFDSVPVGQPAIALLGSSKQALGPLRLPFDLGSLGAPSCWIHVGGAHAFVPMTPSGNGARTQFVFPFIRPSNMLESIYTQGIVLDRTANPAGLTTSDGLQLSWRRDGR